MLGCDIVYHCAATAHEGLSVFSPHFITTNIVGASTGVFSAAAANKVKRIINCSSMARYGAITPPFDETMAPQPHDPYGVGKLAAEQLLENICKTHGIEYTIAVPHNIIGPRQKYDDPYRNVASIMINLYLQDRQPIIYGDGQQQRCFSFISDCVFCLKEMAFSDKVIGEVINIGPDEGAISILDLAHVIAGLLGKTCRPTFVNERPREVRIALCSANKARRLLGYKTSTTLEDGLREMITHIKARGVLPFTYHLPLEIINEKTPKTWLTRLF
jgi:UDP-glucose 4-epimerase